MDKMAQWWQTEIVDTLLALEKRGELFSPEEEELIEALAAPLVSNMAASSLMATHALDPNDPEIFIKMARAAILYAYLIGKGVIKPVPFPISTEELYHQQHIDDNMKFFMGQQNGQMQ